jgi:hypothetical protein
MRETEDTALLVAVGDPGKPHVAHLRRRVGEPFCGHAPDFLHRLTALATHWTFLSAGDGAYAVA